MPYYLTTISISLNSNSDENAQNKIEKIMNILRENKECTPYVNSISKRNHENKSEKLDDRIIKQLNFKP